jgi:hydrogenase maturation protease HycI
LTYFKTGEAPEDAPEYIKKALRVIEMENSAGRMSVFQEIFASDVKTAFVGIGSELRGDDAVGVVIVNRLAELSKSADCPRFLFLNGGSAPENILGEIRAFQPGTIVFIDAAILGGEPGTVKLIDTRREKISGVSFCTHSLPLTIIADYIRQTVPCEIFVIGIEPVDMNFRPDCALTPPVAQAAADIIRCIAAYTGLSQ